MALLLTGAEIREKSYHILQQIPQEDKVYFELRTPCKTTKYAISDTSMLRASPDFDVMLKTVVIVTGGISDTQRLVKAYHCRGNVNVIVSLSHFF